MLDFSFSNLFVFFKCLIPLCANRWRECSGIIIVLVFVYYFQYHACKHEKMTVRATSVCVGVIHALLSFQLNSFFQQSTIFSFPT